VPVTTRTPAGAPVERPTPPDFSMLILPANASVMARYPVQRHRFPLSSSGRSATSTSPNVDAVVIIPAVQKPH
jgi:hypothetical protein